MGCCDAGAEALDGDCELATNRRRACLRFGRKIDLVGVYELGRWVGGVPAAGRRNVRAPAPVRQCPHGNARAAARQACAICINLDPFGILSKITQYTE